MTSGGHHPHFHHGCYGHGRPMTMFDKIIIIAFIVLFIVLIIVGVVMGNKQKKITGGPDMPEMPDPTSQQTTTPPVTPGASIPPAAPELDNAGTAETYRRKYPPTRYARI